MVQSTAHHQVCRREPERLRSNPREMALSELVLAAVVRIGTNPRIFQPCPSAQEVFAFVDALRSPVEARRISPGSRHWTIFYWTGAEP